MTDQLTQVGLGGVIVVVVLDKVFAFVRRRNGNGLPDAKTCVKHGERLASLEASVASLQATVDAGFKRLERRFDADDTRN